ncbi:MAG: signal peptidase II [Chloroflexi bacterium]|nr:signal peptidase II [Chloroflexota bacterium]|tara:strand:+ start:19298 stop:19825 length:528 start_codon:yes stop_codon:yes gene_type:complete
MNFNQINIKKLLIILSISSSILILDQITKILIRFQLDIYQSIPEQGFFRLTHIRNTGSAFSLVKDQNMLLTIIGIIVLMVLIYFLREFDTDQPLVITAISLQIGGALGNLSDRIFLGSVIDFIDIGVSGVYRWPTFNIADSSIVVGITLLIFSFFITSNDKNNDLEKRQQSRKKI